jgi:hypothetical protein
MLVDLEAVVNPGLSVSAAHHATSLLRRAVMASRPSVREVLVRVVPARVPALLPDLTNEAIDAELRRIAHAAAPSSLVLTVSSVTHHFLPENASPIDCGRPNFGLTAEVAIVLRPGRSLSEACEVTRIVQEKLEASTLGDARLPLARAIVRIDTSVDGRALVQQRASSPEKHAV